MHYLWGEGDIFLDCFRSSWSIFGGGGIPFYIKVEENFTTIVSTFVVS